MPTLLTTDPRYIANTLQLATIRLPSSKVDTVTWLGGGREEKFIFHLKPWPDPHLEFPSRQTHTVVRRSRFCLTKPSSAKGFTIGRRAVGADQGVHCNAASSACSTE